MKKRPTWATVVGIMGIIFASFGIFAGAQELLVPSIMKIQKKVFSTLEREITKAEKASSSENKPSLHPPVSNFFSMFEDIYNFPRWFSAYSISSGVARIIIHALYLFASIFLLQMKPSSIRLFYGVVGSSIVLTVIRSIIAITALSFIGMTMMMGGIIGLVIDVVLLAVVLTGNKEAFQQEESPVTV